MVIAFFLFETIVCSFVNPLKQGRDLFRLGQLPPQFPGQSLGDFVGCHAYGLAGVVQGVLDDGAAGNGKLN